MDIRSNSHDVTLNEIKKDQKYFPDAGKSVKLVDAVYDKSYAFLL